MFGQFMDQFHFELLSKKHTQKHGNTNTETHTDVHTDSDKFSVVRFAKRNYNETYIPTKQ